MGEQSVSQLKVTVSLDEDLEFSFASSLWDKALLCSRKLVVVGLAQGCDV